MKHGKKSPSLYPTHRFTCALVAILLLFAQTETLFSAEADLPSGDPGGERPGERAIEEWADELRTPRPVEVFSGFDRASKPPPPAEDTDRISVWVAVDCGGDTTLEARIHIIAEDRLNALGHITLSKTLEEANVMASFTGFRNVLSDDVEREIIVYSFAYGTPDIEFVGWELVTLPRYIYHEAIMTTRGELASCIRENVRLMDERFLRILRRSSVRPPPERAIDLSKLQDTPIF